MKRVLVLVLLLASLSAARDGKHFWRTGRLASFNSESWTSSSTAPVNCGSVGDTVNCSGGGTTNWSHLTYYATVVDGRDTFYGFRTLSFRWQHSPALTENTKIKFAVDGKNLILVADDGREFKMSIGKKRQNSPDEQLAECGNSLMDMHQEFATPEALEDGLRKLSGQDLYNTFISNLECSSLSMQFQEWGLLTQFEAVRLTMLKARTSAAASDAPQYSEQICAETITWVKANPAISLTTDQLSNKAAILYQCAMADYAQGGDRWFLKTGEARNKLLTEIVARQANAGIGEHYVAQPASGK